jgi:hypothetical protein
MTWSSTGSNAVLLVTSTSRVSLIRDTNQQLQQQLEKMRANYNQRLERLTLGYTTDQWLGALEGAPSVTLKLHQ